VAAGKKAQLKNESLKLRAIEGENTGFSYLRNKLTA
jgi:hypothetical protein